jgi:hypothetical protein
MDGGSIRNAYLINNQPMLMAVALDLWNGLTNFPGGQIDLK